IDLIHELQIDGLNAQVATEGETIGAKSRVQQRARAAECRAARGQRQKIPQWRANGRLRLRRRGAAVLERGRLGASADLEIARAYAQAAWACPADPTGKGRLKMPIERTTGRLGIRLARADGCHIGGIVMQVRPE